MKETDRRMIKAALNKCWNEKEARRLLNLIPDSDYLDWLEKSIIALEPAWICDEMGGSAWCCDHCAPGQEGPDRQCLIHAYETGVIL